MWRVLSTDRGAFRIPPPLGSIWNVILVGVGLRWAPVAMRLSPPGGAYRGPWDLKTYGIGPRYPL
jgi:hypothetical protein